MNWTRRVRFAGLQFACFRHDMVMGENWVQQHRRVCTPVRPMHYGRPATLQAISDQQRDKGCIHRLAALISDSKSGKRLQLSPQGKKPQHVIIDALNVFDLEISTVDTELLNACVKYLDVCTFSTVELLRLVQSTSILSSVKASILLELVRRNLLAPELVGAFGACVATQNSQVALEFWALICWKRHELSAEDKTALKNWFTHRHSDAIRSSCIEIAYALECGIAERRNQVQKRFKLKFAVLETPKWHKEASSKT